MGVLWPYTLILLGLIPLLVGVYVLVLRRRKRYAVGYSSLSLVRQAMGERARWRRHVPFGLFMVALASLVIAGARPYATITVPSSAATVMLALDVSYSMCSSDIQPNRLAVAQKAAENFIMKQDAGTRIGIVAFAGFAELVAPPTHDRDVLLEAVRNLTTARRTAVGSAILRSLDAISEVNPEVAPVDTFVLPETGEQAEPGATAFQPDIIVLLTDGASNSGAMPLDAAQAAADRGVRVYTIGFGTPQGSMFNCTLEQLGGVEFGGGFGGGPGGGGFGRGSGFGGGGGGFRRGIDEDTLIAVADMTQAEYYSAESAEDLLDVFESLPGNLVAAKVNTEISALFAALGAVLALAAFGLSQRWSPLPG